MSWTEERITVLRVMWDAGATASQIAEALGGVSRNAVIGKAHRLGFEMRSIDEYEQEAAKVSNLRVTQVRTALGRLFGDRVDTADLNPADKELANKTSTRELAALAVMMATGCSVDDAAASVTDGSHDNGIDALFHDMAANEVIVVQSKLIQSGSGEPSSRDIGQFVEGASAVIEQRLDDFDSRLHGKILEVGDALSTVGTTVRLITISTGSSTLSDPASNRVNRIVAELNGPDDIEKVATSDVFGLAEVYRYLASGADSGSIDVDLTVLDWSYVGEPFGAYFGTVDGSQLKRLWSTFGKRLVEKNIRNSLGSTEVNDAIRKTATEEPERFWYYNNGITLVAEEARRAPAHGASQRSGVFLFSGASIVNGAQTVSTLASVDNDENLGKVRVGVRVIILKDSPEGFGGAVTRTNNLQNRVEGRDFVAQDPEQSRLQNEMAMESVEYQYLRGASFVPTDNSCELIEVTTALACATGDPGMAVLAKSAIGRFFADINRAPYKSVFNPTLTGARAFNAVILQREIDSVLDAQRKSLEKKSGSTFGALVHGNRVIAAATFRLLNADLNVPIEQFRSSLDRGKLDTLVRAIVEAFVDVIDREYPNKFLAVLFKSQAKSKELMDIALAQYSVNEAQGSLVS